MSAASEDLEVPMDEIPPEDDVFSYFLLAQPREKRRTGKNTPDAFMSMTLVYLVLGIQAVLLYCVYMKVVVNNEHWRNGIMDTGENSVAGMDLFAPKEEGCNDGSSLCTWHNGNFTCAPPSIQLSGRWDELDLNGDGVWSYDEVMQNRKNIKCKYALDPVEAYDVFTKLIMNREALIWIHPDVRSSKGIHKSYFEYAMGDVLMCGYRNEAMCGNLLQRGFFDAPLKYGTAPRVGRTIDSALDYCRKLLQPRGYCETFLPSTYATWKIQSTTQCDIPKYKKFVYENPGSGVIKSLLAVDYKARQRYANAKTPIFQLYKSTIVGTWILIIISQFRGVLRVFLWLCTVEGEKEQEESPRRRRGEDQEEGIDMHHRLTALFITIIRMGMLCILMYVGLNFLSRQTDYIGLLMDGIALIFIIEIAEIIYVRVVRHEVRAAWSEHDSLHSPTVAPPGIKNHPDWTDLFWLFVVMLATAIFTWHLRESLVGPLYDSLNCACLNAGDNCREAANFDKAFWSNYWRYEVPKVLQDFDAMKAAFDEADASAVAFSMPAHRQGHHVGMIAAN